MQSNRLPDAWVKSLLNRMSAMYGTAFAAKWERTDPAEMHNTWADALGPYSGEQIKWALDSLLNQGREFPPSLPEFVGLCKQAPRPQPVALPAPEVTPEQQTERMNMLEKAARKIAQPNADMIGWARNPPQKQFRAPWAKLIIDCVAGGDERFRPILAMHVEHGVIDGDRAREALGMEVA